MSIKLVAFDLDNTLAESNRQISRKNVDSLRKIANKNVQIVILSGNPSSYLLGVGRQLGISNIIISGENGSDIYFGNSLPPTKYLKQEISVNAQKELEEIKIGVNNLNQDYFYSPNLFNLTPFFNPIDIEAKNALYDYANYLKNKVKSIDIYLHEECVDFTPSNINKGNSLEIIINYLNSELPDNEKISSDEIIVIGDSSNDIPMFNLNYRNIFIKNSFDGIKGEIYDSVDKIIEEILTNLS